MSRWQFGLYSLLAATCAVGLIIGFVTQVGIDIAVECWIGFSFFSVVGWLIAFVVSETRGRIRFVTVLLGPIVGISLAGMLCIPLCSLDVDEIDRHDHPKLHWSRDTAVFRGSVFAGGTAGLVVAFLASWHSTSGCIASPNDCNDEPPQRPPSLRT